MKRQIIKIDEQKCNGCGLCVPNCPEGALQIIDGKARLVSDLFCDGLGACISECPEGAISVIEREAEPYEEAKVMENIIKAGPNTIQAHLKHLKDHNQDEYYEQAIKILKQKGIPIPEESEPVCVSEGCPGLKAEKFEPETTSPETPPAEIKSELRQWPVQLHLLNPNAPFLDNAELLISADCVPFAFANFHQTFLKGKVLINLCPKLDKGINQYVEKLAQIFKTKNIRSIHIVRMEVPCCGGIEFIVQKALEKAGMTYDMKKSIVTIQGHIKQGAVQ
ncbi:MAG: 4Fe-4S dicluster domain-containing protein [Candidatus Aminicenantes bacterium]|nr:4Fe-4S dicluster domain-containing protein [Candidatus Aminicenantes bacterium]